MKQSLSRFGVLFGLLLTSQLAFAAAFFKVSSTGLSSETISITLCLNGKGPLTCQNYNVASLNLSITTTVPNRVYPSVGIKVNRPGYYPLLGCTPIANGYCLFSANNVSPATITPANARYNVVFDAGSSGTRMFIYQTIAPLNPLIVTLFTDNNNIPLASFANNPAAAGNAIQPLLTEATNVLQTYQITPSQAIASVLGTAGMRVLTEAQQAAIYQSVANTIVSNNYGLGETKTISGQQEGLYQWLEVNYLNSSLGTYLTRGIIEIGGASAQVAFVANTPSNPNVIKLTINGVVYDLFSISFLGLGQDLARQSMDAVQPPLDPDNCYPVGYNQGPITGNFLYSRCLANYGEVLTNFSMLSQLTSVPGFTSQSYYGIAAIYFNATFLGISNNFNPLSIRNAITSICSNSYAQLQQLYPGLPQLFNKCADSTYVDSFLYSSPGLNLVGIPVEPVVTISGVPITWTGGYIYLINKSPSILG